MLFQLAPNTPRFEVFRLLNNVFLYFLEQSINAGNFRRELLPDSDVGQACWDNARDNNPGAMTGLTRDKFARLFTALQGESQNVRRQMFEVCRDNQDLGRYFATPNREILGFLPSPCFKYLKALATHLYCATKDLQPIINAAGGESIQGHFAGFRAHDVNGNICKACGMRELAPFRACIADGEQWRADYDHQLCKSKYPLFAVHPDNLIPLCDVCNQDAKKAKNLFIKGNGQDRVAFYPYIESAYEYVGIDIKMLRDPEPEIKVEWTTQDDILLDKLNAWNEVYEVTNQVEGRFRSLEIIIENEINPIDYQHFEQQVTDRARPVTNNILKRKEWAFWYQKLFHKLSQLDIEPFWEKSRFSEQQGADGASYIIDVA